MPAFALASQRTLSRFETQVDGRSFVKLGHAIADKVIARHAKQLKKRARRITIDLDPTDDPTYGCQHLTFFNKHYDNWCYLPVACFLQFDEPDQYAFVYVLRPGDSIAHYGVINILNRTIDKLRRAFDQVTIRVRLSMRWIDMDNKMRQTQVWITIYLKCGDARF